MLISETKPIITKPVTNATFDYFKNRHKARTDIEYNGLNSEEDELKSKLKKFGWERLGAGFYSSVYGNPNKSYVLKINKSPDLGYEKYVDLIHKYRNKHFPRITDMKVLKIGRENYYVYLIEKLYKIKEPTASNYANIFDCVICNFYDEPNVSLEKLYPPKLPRQRNNFIKISTVPPILQKILN